MIVLGLIFIAIGQAFTFIGLLGVIRLPDTLSRLHATGKVSIVGLLFIILGASILLASATPKLILLGIFIFILNPLTSHIVGYAKYQNE